MAQFATKTVADDSCQWAVAACREIVSLSVLDSVAPPELDVLSCLTNVALVHSPPAGSVHSKVVGIATSTGEYFSVYSIDMVSIRSGAGLSWYGPEKAYVAGTISDRLYGDTDWHAHEILDGTPSPQVFYVWGGNDASTGCKYDPSSRPWFRAALELGEGFTPPYADPITGELMCSYVAPLRNKSGSFGGCCIAGSFLEAGYAAVAPK